MNLSRGWLGRALVGGLLMVSPVVLSSSTVSDRSCVGLTRWAEAYRGTKPTLDQLAQFDRAERRAIVSVLTPKVLSELWREQLLRFSRRADLSAAQRALAREAIGLVTPALYDHDAAAVVGVDAFWRRAQPTFPSSDHRRAFLDLGAVAETTKSPKTAAWLCGCNLTFPWEDCGEEWRCVPAGCQFWRGCGVLHNRQCNGECQPPG